MKILGRHLVAEMADCNSKILNDIQLLEKEMKEAARVSGATVVKSTFHRYNPQGLSGIIVIAESHLSIHTWPEYGYAAIDCFTCGSSVDPWKALEYIKNALECKTVSAKEINRGIPSEVDEIIAHKTGTAAFPAVTGS
ncbi:MAG: S-adenosylmethionine decarboxylase proenzyme [candidate division Zixibacteria bacterium HGW-Zixibacteria-1]|nr:MAG: S-adenosylmethionine decarboxylase proenzyme [candidate division Zixibacteria bacterium HGW-Zixibacteria-1]